MNPFAILSFTANSSNNTTRSLVLEGTGDGSLRNYGSGALVWSGNVVNNMTINSAGFSLAGTGTGGNEFAGLIVNNGALGLRLVKSESGTWKVSGNNTFNGLVDLVDGTLQVTTISNIGTASSIGAGGMIRFGGFASTAPVLEYVGAGSTNNKQFMLGGGGTAATGGTILNNGTGALVFNNAAFNATGTSTTNINRALILGGTNAADNAITGVIINNTNAGNSTTIVKTGTGKWILSGANTYTGGTVISNGTLQIGAGGTSGSVLGAITNDATLIFNRSDNLTQSGAISGSGSVRKEGAGTLTLTASNTFTGGITISNGAISVSADNNLGAVP